MRLPLPPMDEPLVQITSDPIDASVADGFARSSDGAVVVFLGVVRDSTENRPVDALEYESYDRMATDEMRKIAAEAAERWSVGKILIVHRVGRLAVGEPSVLVAVSAPHRGEAFDACEYCIDVLKERVPIWKKELFTGGDSHWVNHP